MAPPAMTVTGMATGGADAMRASTGSMAESAAGGSTEEVTTIQSVDSTRGMAEPMSTAFRVRRMAAARSASGVGESGPAVGLAGGAIRSTTRGMAWPKQSRLRKIGAAQVTPRPGSKSDQSAAGLAAEAPKKAAARVEATRAKKPSVSAAVSAVFALSTTRGGARRVKPPTTIEASKQPGAYGKPVICCKISPALTTCRSLGRDGG
eukprot:scaffold15154_cov100-Isochrysis_galbana.AAC.2